MGGQDGLSSKIPLILGPELLLTCPVASQVGVGSSTLFTLFRPQAKPISVFAKLEPRVVGTHWGDGNGAARAAAANRTLKDMDDEGAGKDVGSIGRSPDFSDACDIFSLHFLHLG